MIRWYAIDKKKKGPSRWQRRNEGGGGIPLSALNPREGYF